MAQLWVIGKISGVFDCDRCNSFEYNTALPNTDGKKMARYPIPNGPVQVGY
jgi:hypothetical protein